MARACMAGSTLLVPFQRAFSFSFSTPMISVFNRWISLVLFTGTGFNPSNVFFNLRTTPLHRASSRSPSSVSRSPAACFLVCVAWICSWWRRTKKKRKKEQGKKKTFPTRKTSERTVSHRLMKQEKVVHQDQYHTVPTRSIQIHHPPPTTTTHHTTSHLQPRNLRRVVDGNGVQPVQRRRQRVNQCFAPQFFLVGLYFLFVHLFPAGWTVFS
jgi:hypothetical protein